MKKQNTTRKGARAAKRGYNPFEITRKAVVGIFGKKRSLPHGDFVAAMKKLYPTRYSTLAKAVEDAGAIERNRENNIVFLRKAA